jgi:ABC-type antimicrobial peptide transport system permease subunit
VTAYGIEQRTSEIGVRMALGADRGSVVAMVLRGAFWQVGIGLALGIPGAIGAGYLIASQLFGVRPWDPLMLSGATLLLGLAALIAAVILARRAASVDPMQSLGVECGRRSQIIGWRSAFFAARVRRLPLKVYVQLVDFQF